MDNERHLILELFFLKNTRVSINFLWKKIIVQTSDSF